MLPRTEGRKERLFLGVLRAPASRTVAKARRRQACVLVQSQGSAARRLLSEDRGTPRPPGGGLPRSAPSRRNGAPVIPRSPESSAHVHRSPARRGRRGTPRSGPRAPRPPEAQTRRSARGRPSLPSILSVASLVGPDRSDSSASTHRLLGASPGRRTAPAAFQPQRESRSGPQGS